MLAIFFPASVLLTVAQPMEVALSQFIERGVLYYDL